jgi:hypothetical protein
MQLITPIFAAGWVEITVSIIVFAFYLFGHLASLLNNKPPKPQQPPQRQAKPRAPVAPQQQPRTLEEKLRGEVEEFLRKVQGEPANPEEKKPMVVTQRPLVVNTPRTIVDLSPARETVQEHVSKHISTADVTQHAATLGSEVSQADEKLEAHLQQRFQHQIGTLEQREVRSAPRPRQNQAAAEIAQLLRSPTGMRQIVIASEIMRRPEI